MIKQLKEKVLQGELLTDADARLLLAQDNNKELFAAAAEITQHFLANKFDTCSIINAKNGNCSEDCKWCAQSAHFKTKNIPYPIVSEQECLRHAKYNHEQGILRFALVTSGKRVTNREAEVLAQRVKVIKEHTPLKICASMGLVKAEQLEILKAAGVENYHCNIETAPSLFSSLCTTHSLEQKMETIAAARAVGMRVCSGAIIGMGESMEQRIEIAIFLQKAKVNSIPINILTPIENTPLANTPLIAEEDVLKTIAIFRFINPQAFLRFSGGRARLSEKTQKLALKIGINAAIVGDLLTTIGHGVKKDFAMIKQAGYSLNENTDWEG